MDKHELIRAVTALIAVISEDTNDYPDVASHRQVMDRIKTVQDIINPTEPEGFTELEQLKMENARLRDKVKSLEADLQNSVTWTVEDFEFRARMLESYDERFCVYNRDKFEDALKTMFYNHDLDQGITWFTIDFWLDEMCRFDREAPAPMEVGQIVILRSNQSRWKIVMLDDANNFLVENCGTRCQMWAKPSHFII